MSELIQLFRQEYERTKKSLGQHFLTNRHFVEEIAEACGLNESSCLIEIGPGSGVLTEALYKYTTQITAVDLDRDACAFLEKYKERFFPELTVLNADITGVDLGGLYRRFTVAGNLPYNVSVKIFTHVSKYISQLEALVFMFQKEVAQRIAARPGSKEYSSLSVFAGYYYDIKKIRDIGGGNFWPNANVTSTVLKFIPWAQREPLEEDSFFEFVRRAFSAKRKTLRNNLREINAGTLEKLGFSPSARAEEIDLNGFILLFREVQKKDA